MKLSCQAGTYQQNIIIVYAGRADHTLKIKVEL
jgi:hypothetical protein